MSFNVVDLQKANSSLVREAQALRVELNQEKMQKATRAVHSFSQVVDGMEQMALQAAQGDQNAKLLVNRWVAAFKAAEGVGVGIVLANGHVPRAD